MKTIKLSMRQKHIKEGYIFILPWIIGFFLFFINPTYQSIRLSFSKLVSISGFRMKWLGFDHYVRAFVWDINIVPMFLRILKDTLINTPMIIIFSLFIAILINRNIKLKGFFRGVFLLPVLLGAGFIMEQLLGQKVDQQTTSLARGILIPKDILFYLGPGVSNIIQEFLNRMTVILWKSGVQIILFLGGLQGISRSLYESARCDGATSWEMFWKITLPLISPIVFLNTVYTIIDSFTAASNPMVISIKDIAFRQLSFEYAAAISWIYLVLIFTLIFIVFAMSRFTEKYNN